MQRRADAWRNGGIAAAAARERGGDRSKIKGVLAARIEPRLTADPTPARMAEQELGNDVSLTTVCRTL